MKVNSTIQMIDGEPFVFSAVGNSRYIVVKNGKVVRKALACGADEARRVLRPTRGETLYIKVGGK